MPLSPHILLAEYEDILEHTVLDLLDRHQDRLPDLSPVCIFISNPGLAARLRKTLLDHLPATCRAVIPPFIGSLRHWIEENTALPVGDTRVLSEQARQLLFVEALAENPGPFRQENKWQVSTSLLRLFDELTLNEVELLHQSHDGWLDTLSQAYRCDRSNQHLHQEAELVHTLWQAWHQQLNASQLMDASTAYVERLRQGRGLLAPDRCFYVLAPGQLLACEQHLVAAIADQADCTIVDLGQPERRTDEDARAGTAAFIDSAYDHDAAPLLQRSESLQHEAGIPVPFSIFYAGDGESEARAIDLQVRLWLLEGRRHIGIVSEDRMLSRRVRALLERANVSIQDMAGWSLSTTSAAAVIERWLECIEEDFDYRPMLDLLKSHFFRSAMDRDRQLQAIYRLENDIILHENIGHGIARYRKQLAYRLHRLQNWPQNTYDDILALLAILEKAAHMLRQLYHSKREHRLDKYLEALSASLDQLGVPGAFAEDAAGQQILGALEDMRQGLLHAAPDMHWNDFRTWLGMTLEQRLFSPQTAPSPVRLMSLAQADYQRFDGLIIAAADKQHLPGKPDNSPFFNQSVRKALGLNDWQYQRELKLQRFKRLLQASADVLITCKREENGEPVPLSPWIECLETFNALTRGGSLENTRLRALLNEDTAVFICDTDALPAMPQQPLPALPAQAMPERMSASAHQRLIDCPYRYFAGDGIRLKPPDEIREELQKSDYGERVHTILNAFHRPVKNLPAPFGENLTEANRERAIEHMTRLSTAVFKQDMEDNTLHRSWLHRWLQHVPAYIDWQIRQQQDWDIAETERQCEATLNDIGLTLYGRLDRVDTAIGQAHHQAVIDYKTGSSAPQADVDSGEDVQLATYALLAADTSAVEYLSLDESNGQVRTRARLEGEALRNLTHDVRERLQTVVTMQRAGQPMPAWGDQKTCSYCDFIGLCRRKVWNRQA